MSGALFQHWNGIPGRLAGPDRAASIPKEPACAPPSRSSAPDSAASRSPASCTSTASRPRSTRRRPPRRRARRAGCSTSTTTTASSALQAAGLIEEFRSLILEGREATRVLDQDGTVLLDEPDDGTGGRPEVQRGALRQMLLDSLPRRHRPVGAQGQRRPRPRRGPPRGDLRRRRHRRSPSLLVGADGAWSRVRPLLSDADTRVRRHVVRRDLPVRRRHPAPGQCAKAVGDGAAASRSRRARGSRPTARAAAPCTPTWRCPGRRTGSPASTSPTPPRPPRGSRRSSTAGPRSSPR